MPERMLKMMKFNVGDYEISISAKMNYKHYYNKLDTQRFMNLLSIVFAEAAESTKNKGQNCAAEEYKRISNELFETLKEQGLYDK